MLNAAANTVYIHLHVAILKSSVSLAEKANSVVSPQLISSPICYVFSKQYKKQLTQPHKKGFV